MHPERTAVGYSYYADGVRHDCNSIKEDTPSLRNRFSMLRAVNFVETYKHDWKCCMKKGTPSDRATCSYLRRGQFHGVTQHHSSVKASLGGHTRPSPDKAARSAAGCRPRSQVCLSADAFCPQAGFSVPVRERQAPCAAIVWDTAACILKKALIRIVQAVGWGSQNSCPKLHRDLSEGCCAARRCLRGSLGAKDSVARQDRRI